MLRSRKYFFLSLFVVFTMIASSSVAASSYTIDASLTSSTSFTASEWYATAQTRAMLTLSVSIDTLSQLDDADSDSYSDFWSNSSWVGISRNKQQVMVTGYYSSDISTTVLVIIYTPKTGKIEYLPVVSRPALPDDTAEKLCLTVMQNDNTREYEKNDLAEIYSIIADLQF